MWRAHGGRDAIAAPSAAAPRGGIRANTWPTRVRVRVRVRVRSPHTQSSYLERLKEIHAARPPCGDRWVGVERRTAHQSGHGTLESQAASLAPGGRSGGGAGGAEFHGWSVR